MQSKNGFTRTWSALSEAQLQELADDIAAMLQAGDVIALDGGLGAGKTSFSRALLRAFSGNRNLVVPSPTFTIVQPYEFGRFPVYHFDLFRISDPSELDEIGFDEAVESGAVLIEWPDVAADRLPSSSLTISIEIAGPDARNVTMALPNAETAKRFDRTSSIREFLNHSGWRGATRRHLQGDASTRRYERIAAGENNAVLMDAPARPPIDLGPGEVDYDAVARRATDIRPYIAVDTMLAGAGYSAPEIVAHSIDEGLLLAEDIGDERILDHGRVVPDRYRAAVECLADIHARSWRRDIALPDGTTHFLPPYDHDALRIEVDLFPDWYVPYKTGRPLPDADRETYNTCWDALIARLEYAEKSLVLRDYHSPNITWLGDREGIRRIGLLDIQDALYGPSAYDLASLLQDARADVPRELECELLDCYFEHRDIYDQQEIDAFKAGYAICGAQRTTKILGGFARLHLRDKRSDYLRHLPRIVGYLRRNLENPVLSDINRWFATAIEHNGPHPTGAVQPAPEDRKAMRGS